MKPSAYVETTIVSYLTARPTRDLVRAAEQEITVEWWDARQTFDLYVSQLVLDEAAVAQAMIPRCSAHPGSWWRNNMTPRDSIVEEVRAIRDAIAKEFDYDIELLGRALQERQAKGGRPVVRLAPKRILPEKKVG